ncbi:MAG: DUF3577 domain-containing protein [Azonexus sp.]|nr:DUF3577 domain-containing protein [Azonexus sp.]
MANQQVQSQTQAQAQVQQTQAQQGKDYFDLHTTGIGYFNRIRKVSVNKGNRKGPPSWWVTIKALYGSCDNPSYATYDVRVVGKKAIELIESLKLTCDAKDKIFGHFKIGDATPITYERDEYDENKEPTGRREIAVQIKGRLLLIYKLKVNGELYYQLERNDQDKTGQQQAQGDPQTAQSAVPENRKPAEQPQSQSAARPAQGAPAATGGDEEMNGEPAYEADDDYIPY